jgi:glycosyltransferase involved in cell wall biosynthesis
MAAGLPTVSTAVGGVPSLLADKTGGVLVQAGDAEGFSKAMESLIADRQRRQSMGATAARRARENFDVTNMVRAYEAVYESLLSNQRVGNPSMTVREPITHG